MSAAEPPHPIAEPLVAAVHRFNAQGIPAGAIMARLDAGQPAPARGLLEVFGASVKAFRPEAVWAEVAGGFTAVIPGAAREELLALADQARRTFAREAGATASVGVAYGAADAPTRLWSQCERGLSRALEFGGNRVAEAPRLVVVVGGLAPLLHATKGVLARLDLDIQRYDQPEEALERIAQDRPAIAVVNLLGPRVMLDQIARLRERPELSRLQVVLVTNKGPDPKYDALATRVPGAPLVQGPTRLVPRVVEIIAGQLGVQPRRHLRADPATTVQVTPLSNGDAAGPTAVGWLVNISESGAKIGADQALAIDQQLALAFKLEHQFLTVRAVVVRKYLGASGEREFGVRFEDLSADAAKAIADFVLADLRQPPPEPGPAMAPSPLAIEAPPPMPEEPVRASPRLALPKRLTLKARLKKEGATAISYLKVVDLSEGGFLLVAPRRRNPPFAVGDVVEAFLFGEGAALHCTAEVIRKSKPDLDAAWNLGLRFVSLSRQARVERAKVLYRLSG